jgi:ribonuclease III
MLDIKYIFKNPNLMSQAMIHKSISAVNNERLEFLGDALLGSIIAEWLYIKYPDYTEGQMTLKRILYVCNKSLARLSYSLGIDKELRFCSSITKVTESMLAGTVEALIAAIYLDSQCFLIVRNTVMYWMKHFYIKEGIEGHPKSRLQVYLQERHLPLPIYTTISEFQNIKEGKKITMFKVQIKLSHLDKSWQVEESSVRQAHIVLAEKALFSLGEH